MIVGRTEEGLRYALRQRPASAVAYCALTIVGGTRGEEDLPEGTAHFVEHALFKGTKRKSARVISSYLDRWGGELNAYTTKEEIVLHATVLKEDLRRAADLLMELAFEATFPEKEIEMERGVIIDEIQSYKDVPSDDIYDRFEAMLFEGHPLSRLILGTVKSVRRIRREHLRAFCARWFRYENMVLTLVGPQSEAQLEALVRRLSKRWAESAPCAGVEGAQVKRISESLFSGSENFLPVREKQGARFDLRCSKHNHQCNCVIGMTAPSLGEKERRIGTILLCNILGGPATNSRLNSILREKNGWVYSVECAYTPYADTGIVSVTFGCEHEHLEDCLRVVKREIRRLREEALSPRAFTVSCRQLLAQMAVSAESGEAQALSMGKSVSAFGTVHTPEEDRQALFSLTPEYLRALAEDLFADARQSMLIYE
ncbi:MAG: insulinase family protein [Bacteroidales bacterium]|nr:insulinase family protein [Bacteroidales bacterium]